MDTRKIRKLIELVNETGVGELEVQSGEESVRIRCRSELAPTPVVHSMPSAVAPVSTPQEASVASPASSSAPSAAAPVGEQILSPMVGTVYLSGQPGAKPFVALGDTVKVGDPLCLIEAMKMFNKIESEVAGVVTARLVDNEQPVEYDQPLFVIEPETA